MRAVRCLLQPLARPSLPLVLGALSMLLCTLPVHSARAQQLRGAQSMPVPKVGGPLRGVHPAHTPPANAQRSAPRPAVAHAASAASTPPASSTQPGHPPGSHAAVPHAHAAPPASAGAPTGASTGAPAAAVAAASAQLQPPGTSAAPKLPAPESAPSESENGWIPKTAADESVPAMRYGAMTAQACLAEVARRSLPTLNVDQARGVLAPLRITGTMHGISVHSAIPAGQRATSVFEIFDCRLVLAVDDLTALLAPRDIVELVHMSAYRPPYRGFPTGKAGIRHEGALAIDIGKFVKRDGTELVVDSDYHGYLGQPACAAGPPLPTPAAGPPARAAEHAELRAITCEMLAAKLFSVLLTPGFNAAHHNHFHAEISANSRGFYIR